MSRTVIDLDDALVADVAVALGTRTKKDTVNQALREAPGPGPHPVARRRRGRCL
jgi:Arc/MetJ family transcription regulator